jgi:hypothetical protein
MNFWKEHLMRMTGSVIIVACGALLLYGCAATAPNELTSARLAYTHASAGPAAQLAPADLHRAQEALAQAERSFSKDAKGYHTRDLAYVAERKAEAADAQGSIAMQQKNKAQSDSDFQTTQGNLLQARTQDLSQTREALAASERNGQATAQQLSVEQRAHVQADQRTNEQRRMTEAKTQDLNDTRTALAVSERSEQATAEALSVEQKARVAAEQK